MQDYRRLPLIWITSTSIYQVPPHEQDAKHGQFSAMSLETRIQYQVGSYQRLKKWFLIPPCLTHTIISYESRVKWSNPRKAVSSSFTPRCSSYWKREPSGPPRLWSPILLILYLLKVWIQNLLLERLAYQG